MLIREVKKKLTSGNLCFLLLSAKSFLEEKKLVAHVYYWCKVEYEFIFHYTTNSQPVNRWALTLESNVTVSSNIPLSQPLTFLKSSKCIIQYKQMKNFTVKNSIQFSLTKCPTSGILCQVVDGGLLPA